MSDPGRGGATTRMVLIRHGESVATVERYVAGHRTCRGLTGNGRDQASALRARLERTKEIDADVLVASHYPRAIETAEIVAPALGGLPIVVEAGVGEHDPGEQCDGMTFADFVARWGDDRDWEDPYVENFPGGETFSAFHHRVATALHTIAAEHAGRCIVVVCHGGVVDVAFRAFLRLPITGGFTLHTLNTSITEFERQGPTKWTLHRYNDAGHLR